MEKAMSDKKITARNVGIKEDLADVSHEIWSHWMRYLFSRCEDDDLGMVIDWPDAEHWKRQMNTPYDELTEKEKKSDREQADKILKVIFKYLNMEVRQESIGYE
jgi:hypothetical protein